MAKLTPAEAKLAKLLKAYAAKIERLKTAINEARAELGDTCTHPSEYVTMYKWEHDNGYGCQTWIEGKKCILCCKVCKFPSSSGKGDYWAEGW